jgi:hypothetical protein
VIVCKTDEKLYARMQSRQVLLNVLIILKALVLRLFWLWVGKFQNSVVQDINELSEFELEIRMSLKC